MQDGGWGAKIALQVWAGRACSGELGCVGVTIGRTLFFGLEVAGYKIVAPPISISPT